MRQSVKRLNRCNGEKFFTRSREVTKNPKENTKDCCIRKLTFAVFSVASAALNSVLRFGLGAAIGGIFAISAKADSIEYFTWVPDAAINASASSGSLTLDISVLTVGNRSAPTYSVTGFFWSDGFGNTDNYLDNFSPPTLDPFLPDGDLLIHGDGYTSLAVESDLIQWNTFSTILPDENEAADPDNRYAHYYGDWVPTPTPEPTTLTILGGGLLLLGYGASRRLRPAACGAKHSKGQI
jgi:hypothetical protein